MPRKKLKVILLDDVPNLGRKFDVEEVAMGYFRNYLLPNELAEPATEAALKQVEDRRKEMEKQRKERREKFEKQAKELEGSSLTFKVKTGDQDQVFGSVSAEDIEERLKEKGFTQASVKLDTPIRELGQKQLGIEFGEGVATSITVVVNPVSGE